jgi:3D (Asp-Asp-Asp) domain-containing protein
MPSVYHGLVALAGLTCSILCTSGWATADEPQGPPQEQPAYVASETLTDQADATGDAPLASEQIATSDGTAVESGWAPDPYAEPVDPGLSEPRKATKPTVAAPAKAASHRRSAASASGRVKRVYRVTAYCDQGITASGRRSGVGQCAAPSQIPFGAKVHIPALNRTFVVTDRTNKRFRHNTVDIFMNSEWACKQFGRSYLECEITLPAKGR